MVIYEGINSRISCTTTYYRDSVDSTISTTGPYDNYPDEWVTFTSISKEEEIPVLPKEKPVFERVMKMRNTDGEVRPMPVYRPMRLVSRGNIGVRNYARHH